MLPAVSDTDVKLAYSKRNHGWKFLRQVFFLRTRICCVPKKDLVQYNETGKRLVPKKSYHSLLYAHTRAYCQGPFDYMFLLLLFLNTAGLFWHVCVTCSQQTKSWLKIYLSSILSERKYLACQHYWNVPKWAPVIKFHQKSI